MIDLFAIQFLYPLYESLGCPLMSYILHHFSFSFYQLTVFERIIYKHILVLHNASLSNFPLLNSAFQSVDFSVALQNGWTICRGLAPLLTFRHIPTFITGTADQY
jgi:hypothetical protein